MAEGRALTKTVRIPCWLTEMAVAIPATGIFTCRKRLRRESEEIERARRKMSLREIKTNDE